MARLRGFHLTRHRQYIGFPPKTPCPIFLPADHGSPHPEAPIPTRRWRPRSLNTGDRVSQAQSRPPDRILVVPRKIRAGSAPVRQPSRTS